MSNFYRSYVIFNPKHHKCNKEGEKITKKYNNYWYTLCEYVLVQCNNINYHLPENENPLQVKMAGVHLCTFPVKSHTFSSPDPHC